MKPITRSIQRGLTLIELLVGLTIGLVISLAVTVAYLGARGTTTSTENLSQLNETAKFAMDYIGREIQMAGHYPVAWATRLDASGKPIKTRGAYFNIIAPTSVGYNSGLFGCEGAKFNRATGDCDASVVGAPDSLVSNYFSVDNFGAGSIQGHATDCNRARLALPAYNATRAVVAPIALPLAASNSIGLNPTTYLAQEGAISTRSVSCSGNGGATVNNSYEPVFQGVEDLVILYGMMTVGGTQRASVARYLTANEIKALPPLSVGSHWNNISAVRVCIVVRTLSRTVRVASNAGTQSFENCRSGTTNYNTADGTIARRFVQLFSVRNNITGLT